MSLNQQKFTREFQGDYVRRIRRVRISAEVAPHLRSERERSVLLAAGDERVRHAERQEFLELRTAAPEKGISKRCGSKVRVLSIPRSGIGWCRRVGTDSGTDPRCRCSIGNAAADLLVRIVSASKLTRHSRALLEDIYRTVTPMCIVP